MVFGEVCLLSRLLGKVVIPLQFLQLVALLVISWFLRGGLLFLRPAASGVEHCHSYLLFAELSLF